MASKWLIGMGMIYVILTVVSGIGEGTYFGGTGVATIWSAMTGFSAIDVTSLASVFTGLIVHVYQILVGIFEILTWKFSFFVGMWSIFRYVLCAISLGIIISLILALRGVSSG